MEQRPNDNDGDKAPQDGLVLGMVSSNHVVNPSVFKNIAGTGLPVAKPAA